MQPAVVRGRNEQRRGLLDVRAGGPCQSKKEGGTIMFGLFMLVKILVWYFCYTVGRDLDRMDKEAEKKAA